MSKVRLKDVAEAAGVSKSTVSQFINGRYDYMSKQTRVRLERVVAQLNYVPNTIARSLKTDRTNMVGVIVRDIAGVFTSQAVRGMDDRCKELGFNMVIYNTDFDPKAELQALKSLSHLNMDGLLIVPSGANTAHYASGTFEGVPVVQFQLEHDNDEKDIVVSHYHQAAFDATEYLIGLGHRQIGFVTQAFRNIRSRFERFQGYADALEKHGIEVDERLLYDWQRGSGLRQPIVDILDSTPKPTALFTQHLAITLDVLEALNNARIVVPERVSVLGFDEVPTAALLKVPVTVVQQQSYAIGASAADRLIQRIRHPDTLPERIRIPCRLKVRESCVPPSRD